MHDADRARLFRKRSLILRKISEDERVPEKLRFKARRAADAAEILADKYEEKSR